MTVHAHDHPEFLQHHFDTPEQQFDAGKLGMWLFLATEVLLFGGLFVGYAVWRANHPEMFKYGSQFLDTKLGAINTAVLILSSLTMATAVTAIQRNRRGLTLLMLALTLSGAAGFLVIKYFEYSHKFHEGWYPGMKFYEKPGEEAHSWVEHPAAAGHGGDAGQAAPEVPPPPPADRPPAEPTTITPPAAAPGGIDMSVLEPGVAEEGHDEEAHVVHPLQDERRPANAHMFFNIYFMMTGLHGLHVLVGAIVIVWLIARTARGHFGAEYFTPVDLGGLYWHIVDLIWIFLFPLFYLI